MGSMNGHRGEPVWPDGPQMEAGGSYREHGAADPRLRPAGRPGEIVTRPRAAAGPTAAPVMSPAQVLGPRPTLRERLAQDVFADENLDLLAHVLDDCFRLPGTSIRFGLDGLIGIVPVLGDVLAGLASTLIVIAAWFRGVPAVTLVRMVVNVGIGVVVGAVPLLGDAFDIAWKANRRNYALLTRHLRQPNRHTWRDWAFLLALATAMFSLLAAPLVLLGWLLGWLMHPR
jgi:hypothetical protein